MKSILQTLLFVVLVGGSVFAQFTPELSLEFRGGVTFNNLTVNTDVIQPVLSVGDETFYLGLGEGTMNYFAGFGATWDLGNRFQLTTNLDYNSYLYTISGGGDGPRLMPNEVPHSSLPVNVTGDFTFLFYNIEPGIRYSFSEDPRKGLFVGTYISFMIFQELNKDIRLRFPGSSFQNNESIEFFIEDRDLDNLLFWGVNMGYKFKVHRQFSFAPLVDFRYGLNSFEYSVGNNPQLFNLGGQVTWWLTN